MTFTEITGYTNNGKKFIGNSQGNDETAISLVQNWLKVKKDHPEYINPGSFIGFRNTVK